MKEVEKWMEKAEKDLRAAEINLKQGLFEVAAFLAQQAIEKAMKALYLKRFNKIKKVHDLVILGKDLNLPKKFLKMCKEITAAYIYTRYPDVPQVKEIEKSAKIFVEEAKVIIEWIKKQL